jgi:hypothetical protein
MHLASRKVVRKKEKRKECAQVTKPTPWPCPLSQNYVQAPTTVSITEAILISSDEESLGSDHAMQVSESENKFMPKSDWQKQVNFLPMTVDIDDSDVEDTNELETGLPMTLVMSDSDEEEKDGEKEEDEDEEEGLGLQAHIQQHCSQISKMIGLPNFYFCISLMYIRCV